MGHPIDGDFACDCESCQRRGKSLVQNYLLRKSSSAQRDLYSGEEAMPSIDGDKDPVEDYHTLVRDFSNGDKTMANFEPMFGATDVGNPMDKQSYRAAMVIGPTKEQELAELVKTKDAEIVTLQHTKGYLKIAIFMMAIVAVVSSTAILMLK